ncbi:hypothetical protein [Buchananella hordeovulneris]|uniref:hypothetical protein n=1 Tax=Buchananella hordeovulneris TaxID=52770 RepID=UPI0026DD57EE|nr:hypothetical protein [Buchananella hordeovulneris]MDO5080327.1 hypothetical protein [Buchananella hordeovulneris]
MKISSWRVKTGGALLFVGLLALFGSLLSSLFLSGKDLSVLLLLSLLCNTIGIALAASGWGRMADNVGEILRCAQALAAQESAKGTDIAAAFPASGATSESQAE